MAAGCSFQEKQYDPSLTSTDANGGSGSVTRTEPASEPSGCGADCVAFPAGVIVELAPVAATNSTFVGWAGDCTGQARCTLTMDRAHAVMAMFARDGSTLTAAAASDATPAVDLGAERALQPLRVTTSGDGVGRVTSIVTNPRS